MRGFDWVAAMVAGIASQARGEGVKAAVARMDSKAPGNGFKVVTALLCTSNSEFFVRVQGAIYRELYPESCSTIHGKK